MTLFVADIQVDSNNNLVTPVPVTTSVVGGSGQRMKFKSNKKTVIRLKSTSPFVDLRPNTSLLVRPAQTLDVRSTAPRKRYKVLCGRMVGHRFVEWGGGGFETPPIP